MRGLHFQLDPAAQGKLVTVVSGAIFDVAVDIRAGSPTYGQWAGAELTGGKKDMLYVPEGFAHGFCVTSETAEIVYFCTAVYAPEMERGILWNDPALAIDWPVTDPQLSKKDAASCTLQEVENNFKYRV